MSNTSQQTFQQLCAYQRETATFQSISSLLWWDERTQLPSAGAEYRAAQCTLLAGSVHSRQTDPQLGEWLDGLADSDLTEDPHSDAGTIIRQTRRSYDKQRRLPRELVEELARAAIEGQQIWQQARADDDFAAFRPMLEKLVRLKREEADALGFPECRYDALLDEFEPHERTSNVANVLAALREDLVPLIRQIAESGKSPNVQLLTQHFPTEGQNALGRHAATQIGFDFDRGRLDVTTHPFCSQLGPHDIRITTRFYENLFGSALFSILHEAGHGMYDQGQRAEWYGLPPGSYASLGIHESQSRMWENQVGRSRAFWEYFYPEAQRIFPDALGNASLDEFYFAVNDVRPSLIRVEADEATYNLHILIRFELEQALIEDLLPIADLPGAWNEKYKQYLGIEPPSDADGVLQDIHWSSGSIGYFPTYSLGNLYAAQFFAAARAELGDLDAQFSRGEFQPLLNWLQENIHSAGQCYTAAELVERVTGAPLTHAHLIDHLRGKLAPLYNL